MVSVAVGQGPEGADSVTVVAAAVVVDVTVAVSVTVVMTGGGLGLGSQHWMGNTNAQGQTTAGTIYRREADNTQGLIIGFQKQPDERISS
jgi:hypothetical protein